MKHLKTYNIYESNDEDFASFITEAKAEFISLVDKHKYSRFGSINLGRLISNPHEGEDIELGYEIYPDSLISEELFEELDKIYFGHRIKFDNSGKCYLFVNKLY